MMDPGSDERLLPVLWTWSRQIISWRTCLCLLSFPYLTDTSLMSLFSPKHLFMSLLAMGSLASISCWVLVFVCHTILLCDPGWTWNQSCCCSFPDARICPPPRPEVPVFMTSSKSTLPLLVTQTLSLVFIDQWDVYHWMSKFKAKFIYLFPHPYQLVTTPYSSSKSWYFRLLYPH